MAISTAMCTSFKQESMVATHNFTASTGDVFKVALFKATVSGTHGAATTNAGTPGTGAASSSNIGTDEASGTGYTSGGATLTNVTPTTSGTTAYGDFNDVTWSTATVSADGCEIYNSTDSNKSVSCHDFGGTKTASGGDFILQFPTADATNAILRLA